MKPSDLVSLRFPQADLVEGKLRPALVWPFRLAATRMYTPGVYHFTRIPGNS